MKKKINIMNQELERAKKLHSSTMEINLPNIQINSSIVKPKSFEKNEFKNSFLEKKNSESYLRIHQEKKLKPFPELFEEKEINFLNKSRKINEEEDLQNESNLKDLTILMKRLIDD